MPTTPYAGLPYPDGTEFVVNGDDAIQALAEALDERFLGSAALNRAAVQSIPNNIVTFVAWTPASSELAGDFAFGTDGANPDNLLVYNGPTRWFAVVAQVQWSTLTAGTPTVQVVRNGVDVEPGSISQTALSATAGVVGSVISCILKLEAGDELDVRILQVSGSATNVTPRMRVAGLS